MVNLSCTRGFSLVLGHSNSNNIRYFNGFGVFFRHSVVGGGYNLNFERVYMVYKKIDLFKFKLATTYCILI